MTAEKTGELTLPLDETSKQALLEGTKLCATWLREYGCEGARFTVRGETFEITGIAEFPLGYVADAFYKIEGFDSAEDFIAAWEKLYPQLGFSPSQPVMVHTFRRVVRNLEGSYDRWPWYRRGFLETGSARIRRGLAVTSSR